MLSPIASSRLLRIRLYFRRIICFGVGIRDTTEGEVVPSVVAVLSSGTVTPLDKSGLVAPLGAIRESTEITELSEPTGLRASVEVAVKGPTISGLGLAGMRSASVAGERSLVLGLIPRGLAARLGVLTGVAVHVNNSSTSGEQKSSASDGHVTDREDV